MPLYVSLCHFFPSLSWQDPLTSPLKQFSLGFFFFIDASTYSASLRNGSDVNIKFVDWIPSICSSLGMLVINSIEKTRLSADSYSYSGTGVAWKARLVLFLGFALMAGGLAGSVVSRSSLLWTLENQEGTMVRRIWMDCGWSVGGRNLGELHTNHGHEDPWKHEL